MVDDFCASLYILRFIDLFIYLISFHSILLDYVAVEQGLPTSLVDLTQCRPVPIRQTLVFVNTFVIESVEFLNHFADIFVRYCFLL